MAGRPLYNLPNATTVESGDKFLIQQGVSSKQVDKDVLLAAENSSWQAGKSVGYSLDDLQGFTSELYSQGNITDNGLPDELGNSKRVDAINYLIDEKVGALSSQANISSSAPSLPTLGDKNKALFKPSVVADAITWVVSRKAQGKAGWVAVAISNTVSPADAQNYGGASNYRPTYVINALDFKIAKTAYSAKTAGTVLSSLTSAQINTIWGHVVGIDDFAVIGTPPYSWQSRQCYDCIDIGNSITYLVNNDCKIRFGMTNASSNSVKVSYSSNGTDFIDYQTISLKQPPSGTVTKRDLYIKLGISTPTYIKIENLAAGNCFVAGLNIGTLQEYGSVDYDSAVLTTAPTVGGVPNQYQGGTGANEFAAKELSSGKLFGTYHGGHSEFAQRLRTSASSINIDSSTPPNLLITTGVQLHSASDLTVSSSAYKFTAETSFGDGTHITTYSIQLVVGSPIVCERVFTHMCTAMRDFNWIHLPLTVQKTDDGDVNVGDCQFIQQFRAYDAAHLNCYFSGLNMAENGNGGAYVSFQPNYNKQYYGPALLSSSYQLTGGQFVTAKEYF
jgi:hypothetical protein